MSKLSKIFLIVIVYVAVLTIFVFVRNTRNNYVNHPLANYSNYLDIQMEIHNRGHTLIMDIDSTYHNSPEDIKLFLNYIEKLHEEAIVLGNSNSNRLAKITVHAEEPESLRWISERLAWVMQPIDKVSDRDTKITILIMNMEIEYLHGSLILAGGGVGIEEAMAKVEDFKKKFKK